MTNLVIVPAIDDRVTVESSAGGHLVVDLVGTFDAPPEGATAGRFLAVDSARVAALETAVDGRQARLTFQTVVSPGSAAALVAVIIGYFTGDDAPQGTNGRGNRSGPGGRSFDRIGPTVVPSSPTSPSSGSSWAEHQDGEPA